MAGEVNLAEALESLRSSSVTTRKNGLNNVRHILRSNSNSTLIRNVGNASFLDLYQALFQFAIDERAAAAKAKSQSTRTSSYNRLVDVAATLRISVEAGVTTLRSQTVGAVLDHVFDMICLPTGDFNEAVALDYAKCVHALLKYQPHVEQLTKEWKQWTNSCITALSKAASHSQDAEAPSTTGSMVGISIRSSRSHLSASQDQRSGAKHLAEEFVACLRLLTAAPNAPLSSQGKSLLKILIEFVQGAGPSSQALPDAFTAINQVLGWSRTNNIALTRESSGLLVRVIRQLWSTRSRALAEMLSTLLLIQPYLFHGLNAPTAHSLRLDIAGTLQSMQNDYAGRQDRDKQRQLTMDDLRLETNRLSTTENGLICTSLFSLRCVGAKSETNWLHVHLMTSLYHMILKDHAEARRRSPEHGVASSDIQNGPPNKRARLQDPFTDLLDNVKAKQSSSKICALQSLAFLCQQWCMTAEQWTSACDAITTACSDENSGVASWALLAMTACMSQAVAAKSSSVGRCASVWQMASRSLSSTTTCRAAAYLLFVMLRLQLIAQSSVLELAQNITETMDLHGPAQLSEAAMYLLRSILAQTRRFNPGEGCQTADSMLVWLSRVFTPSKIDDKVYVTSAANYEAVDVLLLVHECLSQDMHAWFADGIRVWDAPARIWLQCKDQATLVSYLLLNDVEATGLNPELDNAAPPSSSPGTAPSVSSEALILSHLSNELARINSTWGAIEQDRAHAVSFDTFTMLCKAGAVFNCISSCISFRDKRRHSDIQQQTAAFMESLSAFTSTTPDETKADVYLTIASTNFTRFLHSDERKIAQPPACEQHFCKAVAAAVSQRHQSKNASLKDEDMDMDDPTDSQGSRHSHSGPNACKLSDHFDVAFGKTALRSSVALYAEIVTAFEDQMAGSQSVQDVSTTMTEELIAQPESDLLASRNVIRMLPKLGLSLSVDDTEDLLDRFTRLIGTYTYAKSEVAQITVLDVMESQISQWTDRSNKDLYNLGIDAYRWFTETALPGKFLSPKVQRRLATLLRRVFDLDTEYPKDSEAVSISFSLFTLIQQGDITLQFELADQISSIFGGFTLSEHQKVFEDLVSKLPHIDILEGTAMRLRFLSRLGATWHSLLRLCVYYLFEIAGQGNNSQKHAAYCINELSSRLPVGSPQRLFSLFAPQLLNSWKDGNFPLTKLPFAVFQYKSLTEMLAANESEVCAQLTLRGSPEDIEAVSKLLKLLPGDLFRRSFPKCFAYAVNWDIAHGDLGEPIVEARLREAIGGKSTAKELLHDCWPQVIGHLYLTLQQDDVENRWLERRESYTEVRRAMSEVMNYSHSPRALPQSQQPFARASSLPSRIERVLRRMSYNETPWTASSFALTARMLLDRIDESLGSLHSCLIIRRLRMLICMAGPHPFEGFAIEMLIHSLRPFVGDNECADDTIGLLQYLFYHGRSYFKSKLEMDSASDRTHFLVGTVVLLVLQMRRYSMERLTRSTQESQHNATVQKMEAFLKWLVTYLQDLLAETGTAKPVGTLTDDLATVHLPGSARTDTAESRLLLFLLKQWHNDETFCSKADVLEAITIIGKEFDVPSSTWYDCLGDDSVAAQYSEALWDIVCSLELNQAFMSWASQVLGRMYAATGSRPARTARRSFFVRKHAATVEVNKIANSHAIIAETLISTLLSRSRLEAGVADHCIRDFLTTQSSDAEGTQAFEQMLPETVLEAMSDGTFGYSPPSLEKYAKPVDAIMVAQAFECNTLASFREWASTLASTLCCFATRIPLIRSLAPLVQNVEGSAVCILPSILHILLIEELDQGPPLRDMLSATVTMCLSDTKTSSTPKQRYMLELLLYLRSQPYPGETTKVDRLRWLDVDYLLAAECASRCGIATSALLLAESAPTGNHAPRRLSTRNSSSQVPALALSEELLASIYQQLEEPDSFYGVPRPASLESVLHRLDHEADGFKSLMFRSAQMDSQMRQVKNLAPAEAVGLIHSLRDLSFNSLTFALLKNGLGHNSQGSRELLFAAQALQQWDIPVPESVPDASTFKVYQELSRAVELFEVKQKIHTTITEHARTGIETRKANVLPHSWYSTLASLTEAAEVLSSSDHAEMNSRWEIMEARGAWMHLGSYEEVRTVISNRQTLFGVLRQNKSMQKMLRLNNKQSHTFEAKALLYSSRLAREHSRLQDALAASTTLNSMSGQYRSVHLNIEGAIQEEIACVLWDAGEPTSSVKMLRNILELPDLEKQDISIGKAGLHAQLARQLAEARLEKPEEILSKYLRPAISDLKSRKNYEEAGRVHYEFASFCDRELSNPANVENLVQIEKLRIGKEEEVEAIKTAIKNYKRTGDDRQELQKLLVRAQQWVQIDSAEEKRLRGGRMSFIHQSLQNYLLTLRYTDTHDISVLRFFALWLENADDQEANGIVLRYLPEVPSWKFVLLMNQLMSRIAQESTTFQKALQELLHRILKEHPHHSVHHLFASCQAASSQDQAANSRFNAALRLFTDLRNDPKHQQTVVCIWKGDQYYRYLAEVTPQLPSTTSKCRLRDIPQASNVAAKIPGYSLPPVTLSIPLRPSGDYADIPKVRSFEDKVSIMTGLSHPKVLNALDSSGQRHRQLFKGGDDDLRQDAIMEQVFEEVSKMLRNHKATRQRDLKVRTYKVIPLSTGSGIIEFVPNSMPLNDYLKPAHKAYYPHDISESKAREMIRLVEKDNQDNRLKQYRKICDQMHPVLRHFFLERFDDPDEWFEKRTAYTRTTASISILGHILGLGDRHNSNILLDEKTGEIVHIDLGVAFEAGRVLPIPEKVPFRLTRDITDGMGVTKTEGVFRRCCEFTLDAVRQDKESIMTLLNVLRYDPLYSWSISPLRAKRMQEIQELSRHAGAEEIDSSKRREQEAGEADRALSIVEKKLSNTLSTQAVVNELIQQANDEVNLATLFAGWGAFW